MESNNLVIVKKKKVFYLLTLCLFVACSGGGGGGGNEKEVRTRNTALRILHGSIDMSPLSLRLLGQVIQTARYAQAMTYVPIKDVTASITLEAANLPETIIEQFPSPLKENTEYSVFVFGNVKSSDLSTVLLEDIVKQPPDGRALLRVISAYESDGSLKVNAMPLSGPLTKIFLGEISVGSASGFVEMVSGEHTIIIEDRRGREITRVVVNLSNQSESTVLVTGSQDLGAVFTTVYEDLD